MKPTSSTNRALVWRFREIGIVVSFYLDTRLWGGSIEGAGGARLLPIAMLDTIIATHRLQEEVTC